MSNRGYVIGKTTVREIYIVSQDKPFIQNEYLMIDDELHGDLPIEVLHTTTVPFLAESIMPEGFALDIIKGLSKQIVMDRKTHIARAKVLKTLTKPVTPNVIVRDTTFEEMKKILIHAKPSDALTLGVILGTEELQSNLPQELTNIAPLWRNGEAVHQEGVPFVLNYRKFREYPHIGVFGTSGSGKTFGLRVLEEEIQKIRIPGVAFDPHNEMNFVEPMDGLDENLVYDFQDRNKIFYIGKDVGINFHELKLDELMNLFDFVGELTEPQRGALEVLYEKGDTLAHLKNQIINLKVAFEVHENPKPKGRFGNQNSPEDDLSDEQALLYERNKNRVSGSKTLQALSWKLDALESTNIFVGDVDGVESVMKQGKIAVIRGDMLRQQMIASYILRKLYKKRRDYQDYQDYQEHGGDKPEFFPMFFVIVDEAHNFAPRHSTPTKKVLKKISQEARKYGVFEIFCTQKPDALDPTIVAQLNTKFIYRLNTADDMEMVRKETNLTEDEMKRLPELPSGHCFVSSATLPKTFAVRFRTTFTKSPHMLDPFDEFQMFIEDMEKNDLSHILKEFLPIKMGKLAKIHDSINEKAGRVVAIVEISEELGKMTRLGIIEEKKTMLGNEYLERKVG
ncbi:ATP-binding protein [Bacillus sp. NPDC094106]|uniref:ATP-binding protein n=1 Tax=Bacillus sp. NPDC094106 TaxID=3363949 RepID=UPI0037F9497F